MSILEEMQKSAEIHKEIEKITRLQSSGKALTIYFSILLYWFIAFLFHSRHNTYRLPGDHNYTTLAIALIIFIFLFISSKTLRLNCLVSLASIILVIYSLWSIFKWLVLILYKIFCFIFKIANKVEEKYNNLDEKDKSKVRKLIFILLGFAAKCALKELASNLANNDSTFVNPHEVNGYTRNDGTEVSSYFRDGDGNPLTNLTKEQGGGFFRDN